MSKWGDESRPKVKKTKPIPKLYVNPCTCPGGLGLSCPDADCKCPLHFLPRTKDARKPKQMAFA